MLSFLDVEKELEAQTFRIDSTHEYYKTSPPRASSVVQSDIQMHSGSDELFRVPFHSQTLPEALVGGVGYLLSSF